MELVVALIGLAGATIGLVTAAISKKREVVHRQELPGGASVAQPGSPGALVFRSTLFGFAIGTFFGVMASGTILTLAKVANTRVEEAEPYHVEALLRNTTGDAGYKAYVKEQYIVDARQRREEAYHKSLEVALLSPLPCGLLGTFLGLWIGLRLARLSVGSTRSNIAVGCTQCRDTECDSKD